jgi:hypothetical protein
VKILPSKLMDGHEIYEKDTDDISVSKKICAA